MGICEAYNKGASMAKYNYLLFYMRTLFFTQKNGDKKLVSHLEKENVGVIGIAGSNYVPRFPIGWHVPDDKYNFLYLIQNDKNSNQPKLINNIKSVQEVYALDGVFMAVKKKYL